MAIFIYIMGVGFNSQNSHQKIKQLDNGNRKDHSA